MVRLAAREAWPFPIDGDQPEQLPRRFRTLFLSDTHLGAKGCRTDRILDFLTWHDADVIYLVGDIFDNRRPLLAHWLPVHDAIVRALMTKIRTGTKIVYVPGNHDETFRRHYGVYFDSIEVAESALHVAADGKRYFVVHGDCFDAVASPLRWLSSIGGRIDAMVRGIDSGLNKLRRRCGLTRWPLMEIFLARVNRVITRGDLFGKRLAAMAAAKGTDGIVCGHFHRAALHEDFGMVYANCGDWIDSCTAIGEDGDGSLRVINWMDPLAEPLIEKLRSAAAAVSTLAP